MSASVVAAFGAASGAAHTSSGSGSGSGGGGGVDVSLSSPSSAHSLSSASSLAAVLSFVSSCCVSWRSAGLDGLRSSLDASALSLADEEDRASAARSSLSAQSKQLKRAGQEGKLAMLGAVVKAYQEEINALTRRAQKAETAFLSVYQLLTAVPDPTAALQQAVTALQQAESWEWEWSRSRQQVEELDRELSTLKNQDATLRRLEAQLRDVDKRTEQRVRDAIAEHDEANRPSALQDKREAAERESALKHQLDELRASLAQQAATHQQQQDAHFRESEKYEKAAREAEKEVDSLRADNERLQHTLQAVATQRAAEERQNQGGSSQSESLSSSHSSSATELEAEVQSLRDALSAVQLDCAESHDTLRHERAEREADRKAALDNIDRLTLQIAQWKHKALTTSSDSGQQQHGDSEAHSGGGMEETRAVQQAAAHDALVAELAASRASNEQLAKRVEEQRSEADNRIQQLSSAWEEAERTSAHQQQLVAQLEADISVLQQQQQSRAARLTTTAAATSDHLNHPFVPLSSVVTSASIAPAASTSSHPVAASVAARSDSSASASSSASSPSSSPAPCCSCSSLLRIVSGQRDRLRVRVEQLERELTDRQSALVEARSAKQQLQDDNVALYEKLQYVKSFEQQQQTSRATGRGTSQLSSTSAALLASHILPPDTLSAGGGGGGSSERRYAKLYAESLNPFSAWKSGQLLANERSLPPSERVTLTCARLLFSRRAARSFAFFYALLLHLLVFAVLWTHTVSDHCVQQPILEDSSR